VQALLENNVLKAKKLLDVISEYPPERFFCVSTDKAANPVNIMGASKRIMEDMIMAYSERFNVTTARFANVAFSQGSLLASFIERIMKKQPLSSPYDVKRYFVSLEESGQICMLACVLGNNRELLFPKLKEEQMMTFSSIAEKMLQTLGYEIKYCESEEAARKFAAEMPLDSNEYPVFFFRSDTTGEKSYEEFFIQGEHIDLDSYHALGVIDSISPCPMKKINVLLDDLKNLLDNKETTKEDIVLKLKEYLPNFVHEEKGRNLDQKM
jgi:FlaA1/EpsC-like NDP-sugar epimerase